MLRYFSNLFTIILSSDVESINGNTIITKGGEEPDFILTRNDLQFSETNQQSGANDIYSQTCAPASHSISEAQRKKYRRQKVIIQLKTTQGEIFTWGSLQVPVRVTLNSELNTDKWQLSRSATTPLIQ